MENDSDEIIAEAPASVAATGAVSATVVLGFTADDIRERKANEADQKAAESSEPPQFAS